MKYASSLACSLLLAVAAPACLAAGSPWTGTWKEDYSKSKLTGSTITITKKGAAYHFSNGPVSYDFACDGKPYPTIGNGTFTCTPTPDSGFDIVMAANGVVTTRQHRTFSADGKQMIMKSTNINPDGTTSTSEVVRVRKSGTTGLVGEWVDEKVAPSEPALTKISVNGDSIHWEFVHAKEVVDAKLDGSDVAIMGPQVSPGTTMSIKAVSPNKLSYMAKLHGKPMFEGTMTLSSDGKTFTDVSWSVGKENERSTELYVKQ